MRETPPFASEYDARIAAEGPPSLFTMDPSGKLRVDPERTREGYLLMGSPEGREPAHYVLTDTVTGLRLYLFVTHPVLATCQPRGAVVRYADAQSAIAEVAARWEAAPS